MENAFILILFFSYTFLLGFIIHKFLIKRSQIYNLHKANTSGERWEQQFKPVFGGIAFFSLFIFALINYIIFFGSSYLTSPFSIAIILVITIAFLMGLADDLLNTSPLFKFGMQLAVALILIYFDVYIKLFNDPALNYLLTIFWVVGIMNSINMLDNMDAITTSTGLIILLFIGIIIAVFQPTNMWFYLIILFSAYAAMGSFLIFNWHPSKMYMGDNGSQFLGAILAVFSIQFIWNHTAPITEYIATQKIITVILTFTMPLTDTATVSINRVLRGQSPFVGGKDHTTHHLSYAGLSDSQVAIIFILGSIISTSLAFVLTYFYPNAGLSTLLLFMIWPIIVFVTLYSLTKIVKPK